MRRKRTVILNPSAVILNPSAVILNPSAVILNAVKDLTAPSWLRAGSVEDLPGDPSSRFAGLRMTTRGFTLIEVMIAMTILVSIVTMVWQSFGSNMRAKERWEQRSQFNEAVGIVLNQMCDELAGAFMHSAQSEELGRDPSGELLTNIVFVGEDRGEEDSLLFHSFSHFRLFKDSKESDQESLFYQLERDEEGEVRLWRLMKRFESPPDTTPDEGGSRVMVLDRVVGLNFRYYDPADAEWKNEWDSEGPDHLKKLPRAVEITITLKPPDVDEVEQVPVSFMTTALLELSPGPNDF